MPEGGGDKNAYSINSLGSWLTGQLFNDLLIIKQLLILKCEDLLIFVTFNVTFKFDFT